jgi:hypothetical protein
MAWGKTEEEKERERLEKEQQRATDAAAKAQAAYDKSPVGKAQAAFNSGARFFQIEIEVSSLAGYASTFGSSYNSVNHSGNASDVLGQIEEVGWHLEHAGWVFIETGATSTNRVLSTGQGTVTKGNVTGVYLFRRA